MRYLVLVALLSTLVLAVAGPARAASLPVPNGGFEDPVVADGSQVLGVGAPWGLTGGSSNKPFTQNPAGAGIGVAEGEQRVEIRAGPLGEFQSIRQTLTETYQANFVYVLILTPLETTGVPTLSITLDGLASGNFGPTSLTNALGLEIGIAGPVLPGSPFIGQPIAITAGVLVDQVGVIPPSAVALDRVRVLALPVPEPPLGLLTALALLGLAAFRRRGSLP